MLAVFSFLYSSRVKLIVSSRPGMGKSLYVAKMAERLSECSNSDIVKNPYICIPIHGPDVSPDAIMSYFRLDVCPQNPSQLFPQLLHFDIEHSVIPEVDSLLFQILILGGFCNTHGRVWRYQPSQMCIIECTLIHLEGIEMKQEWRLRKHVSRKVHNLG